MILSETSQRTTFSVGADAESDDIRFFGASFMNMFVDMFVGMGIGTRVLLWSVPLAIMVTMAMPLAVMTMPI